MQEAPEWIYGLPFYTPRHERSNYMTIGALVEDLIELKRRYEISHPDDNVINDACNILDKLPAQDNVAEWIALHKK